MENEKRIVSVVSFNVTREDFAAVADEASVALQHRLPTIQGFIEGTLLTNEAKTQIMAVTEWRSRHSWATAQWDEDVARVIADLFKVTASYQLAFFYPLVKAVFAAAN